MEVFYENRFKRIRKTHQTYPKRARSDTGIFDVDTPAHHNNQLMEIAAELNPSQRDHVLEILEVMVPYIKN